jgi:uncharacterized protein (TIGR02246 family)
VSANLIGGSVPELSSNDLQAIEDIHKRWIDAELAGDGLELLRLCTDDVVWIPPDFPVLEGREPITRWLKGAEVEIKSIEVTDLRIGGSGTVAYKTGNYTTAYKAVGSSEVRGVKGTHLWILQKIAKGEWRVAIVTWSSMEAN